MGGELRSNGVFNRQVAFASTDLKHTGDAKWTVLLSRRFQARPYIVLGKKEFLYCSVYEHGTVKHLSFLGSGELTWSETIYPPYYQHHTTVKPFIPNEEWSSFKTCISSSNTCTKDVQKLWQQISELKNAWLINNTRYLVYIIWFDLSVLSFGRFWINLHIE
jgi:hypothetical protein